MTPVSKINLFVIGASKCGTTFLHDVLNMHPNICMSEVKEPYIFFGDNYQIKLDGCEDLFSSCKSEVYRGESSPVYSETIQFPDIPRRIFEYNPDARVIYLIREPFSRLQSVYKQTLSTGHWVNETIYGRYGRKMPMDFADAVFSYPPFIDATKYWTHVQRYREFFPDDAISVIFFEELVNDPEITMSSVFQWLGIDNRIQLAFDDAQQNSGEGKTVYNPWPSRLHRVIPNSLWQAMPKNLKSLAGRFIKRLPVPTAFPAVLTAEQEALVREIITPEVQGIYQYLGVTDDPWHFFNKLRSS